MGGLCCIIGRYKKCVPNIGQGTSKGKDAFARPRHRCVSKVKALWFSGRDSIDLVLVNGVEKCKSV
jgi:hypothetical protein